MLAMVAALAVAAPGTADAASKQNKKSQEVVEEIPVRPGEPLNIVVSLADQRSYIFQGTERIASSRISSGRKGYPTPTGVFSILQKNKHHRSNIYSGAPMPFMQRITWSGVALHAGVLPGYPASHGCIRLPYGFAKSLFGKTRMHAHVIVAESKVEPRPIAHSMLFNPIPYPPKVEAACQDCVGHDALLVKVASDASAADTAATGQQAEPRSTAPLRMLITKRSGRDLVLGMQRMLAELDYDIGEIDGYMGPVTREIMRVYQRIHGLTQTDVVSDEVMDHLSRATGRGPARNGHLFVKQEFKDIFDAPVDIRDGEAPMGTWLFQAMGFAENADHVSWVAFPGDGQSVAMDPVAVLDRIAMSVDTRKRIEEMLTPGSSLIVTDRGKSHETNEYTDFIVMTR